MKLGPTRGATTRQQRASELHLDRAAAQALRVTFPAVAQLRLELCFESDDAITPAPQAHVLHPPARAYFVFPCPYSDCSGRFDLNTAVQLAVQDPSHRSDGTMECTGLRAGHFPEKHRCQLRLHFTVTATYSPSP